jgi:hypothetical protein
VNQVSVRVSESRNSPQLPRVATPAKRSASPPRVPTRARNLSPRNLSQGDFWDMGSANNAIYLGNNHWNNTPMMNSVLHPASGNEIKYKDKMKHPTLGPKYKTGFGNELGRICQGIRDIQGTITCLFFELTNIPKDPKITYGKLVCDYKPNKTEKERVILTVGGDRLDYTSEVVTSPADITTLKILINITLSTKDAKMMMLMDIKNYYLGTPLPRYEYTHLHLSIIPDEIIAKYNLQAISVSGWVYLEIRKGMYGLKQAGILAKPTFAAKIGPLWLIPSPVHPWIMITQNKTNCIHSCCGCLCLQVCGKRQCTPFAQCFTTSL